MSTFVVSFVLLLFGFSAMYLLYRPRCNEISAGADFKMNMLPFPYIFGLYFLVAVAAYFLTDNADFVENLTLVRMLFPLIGAALIYLGFLYLQPSLFAAVVAAVVVFTVYLQPMEIGAPFTELPAWVVRLIIAGLAIIYCLGNRVMNLLPHIFIVPQIMVLFGLGVLSVIGAVPAYVGFCAAALIGILAAYLWFNYYELKMGIDDGACAAIAYITCSLLLFNLGEYSFPSCCVLTVIFWAELSAALWNKFVLRREGSLAENTNYYHGAEKYTVGMLVSGMIKINIVILFISWFQLFAVNQYSLLIISMALALWLDGTIGKPLGGISSIKQINKDFVKEVKQNIAEAKKVLTKKDKK